MNTMTGRFFVSGSGVQTFTARQSSDCTELPFSVGSMDTNLRPRLGLDGRTKPERADGSLRESDAAEYLHAAFQVTAYRTGGGNDDHTARAGGSYCKAAWAQGQVPDYAGGQK
jgi:hypothetical protein